VKPADLDAIRKRCLRGNYEDIANVVDHDAPALLDALEQAERLRLAAESEAACQARGVAEVNRCREELRAERDALEKAGLDALRTAERLTGELAAEKARANASDHAAWSSMGDGVKDLLAERRKREEAEAKLAALQLSADMWTARSGQLERDLATQTKRAEEAESRWFKASCNTCGGSPNASDLACICGGTGCMVDEVDGLRQHAFALERDLAVLREALGYGTPWPLHEVLTKLADAADHLLLGHDCDRHGWELVGSARDAARCITSALASVQQKTSGDPDPPCGYCGYPSCGYCCNLTVQQQTSEEPFRSRLAAEARDTCLPQTPGNEAERLSVEIPNAGNCEPRVDKPGETGTPSPDWRALLERLVRDYSWVSQSESYRTAVAALDATKEEK
jgi:hypothetical protein